MCREIVTPPGTVGVQNPELTAVAQRRTWSASVRLARRSAHGGRVNNWSAGSSWTSRRSTIDSVRCFSRSARCRAQRAGRFSRFARYRVCSGQFYGLDNIAGINTAGFAGNSIQNIYTAITNAIATIWRTRYAAPTHILAHPGHHLRVDGTSCDTTIGRCSFRHAQGPMNAAAILDNLNGQGPVGSLLGLSSGGRPEYHRVGGGRHRYMCTGHLI